MASYPASGCCCGWPSFPARTFEELFQGVYHTPLEAIIPKNGAFPVKGHCLGSQLHSVPDARPCEKAAAKRLGEKYHVGWMPETGSRISCNSPL